MQFRRQIPAEDHIADIEHVQDRAQVELSKGAQCRSAA